MKEFYDNKTKAEVASAGGSLTPDAKALIGNGYVSDQVYVEPNALIEELSRLYPQVPKLKGGLPNPSLPTTIASDPPAGTAKPAGDSSKPPTGTPPPSAIAAGPNSAMPAGGAASTESVPPLLPVTIWRPSKDDRRTQLSSLSAMEPFMVYLKSALLAGAILASPMIFRELWLFVAAGLYPHERRYVHIFLPISVGLFILGVLMAFFVALPTVLHFLLGFNEYMSIDPVPRIEEYLSFALFLPLAFGVGFQLPLVMLFVNRIGMVSAEAYIKHWKVAVLGIFIAAMILTPSPDVYTMSLLALPMSLLYFFGIYLCKSTSGRKPVGLGSE